MKLRILLADDHTIVRQSLSRFLRTQHACEVIGEARDGVEAVKLVKELHPDVVIMDISMPNLNGIEATRQICSSDHSKIKIIGLSMHTSKRCVVEMFKAGARGYLPKNCDFDELIEAISRVVDGRIYLSPLILKESPGIEDILETPPQ
ncbi:MAG: response regulator transcription factor [Sedimentisphaerales bacterium]|nr:response regulator transcription factor [Sedimentisphaerales bacterium]